MKDFLLAVVFGGLFAVLALPLYVENDWFFPYITGKNFAFRIIVEMVLAAWVVLALLDKQYRPKFSWLLPAFGGLLVVMFFANLFGEYPLKSFWSNFERMDGYVTLVHLFAYTFVAASVLTTQKLWSYFAHFSLAVATWVALYGIGQQFGVFDGGRSRVDSTLGNAAYMAVYMLFHIFLIFYLSLKNRDLTWRIGYTLLGLVFVYTMLQTGTRGTFLGLVGGATTMIGYVALFGRRDPVLRKYAIGGMAVLVLLAGSFFVVRDMQFMQEGPLRRIANIDIQEDLQTRSVIWSMAYQGIQDRPLLGWGQGNFNYVFNEYYEAELWNKEQWFDRVHNIFFDWLIAGGILGFLAYFSIFAVLVYYCFVYPVILRRESPFSVPEQAILIGLIVAYLLHNFVVFDNIISYIFFGSFLAYVHSKVAQPLPAVERFSVSSEVATQIVAPIVLVVMLGTVYVVNVPGMQAAGGIIDALTQDTVRGRLVEFDKALGQNSFADQEIVEQLTQQAMSIASNQQLPQDERQLIVQRTELELLKLADEKPGDARVHNFIATYYRSIGAMDQAREQAALARSFSPNKPALVLEQGLIELQAGQLDAAEEFMQEAYELETRNREAAIFYASVLFRQGNVEEAKALIDDRVMPRFALNDYAIASAQQAGAYEFLEEPLRIRITERPDNPQARASLAFVLYEQGRYDDAIAVLELAAEEIPSFSTNALCYADNIANDREPTTPCKPVE